MKQELKVGDRVKLHKFEDSELLHYRSAMDNYVGTEDVVRGTTAAGNINLTTCPFIWSKNGISKIIDLRVGDIVKLKKFDGFPHWVSVMDCFIDKEATIIGIKNTIQLENIAYNWKPDAVEVVFPVNWALKIDDDNKDLILKYLGSDEASKRFVCFGKTLLCDCGPDRSTRISYTGNTASVGEQFEARYGNNTKTYTMVSTEQFRKYVLKEAAFPEKWAVKRDPNNATVINNWANTHPLPGDMEDYYSEAGYMHSGKVSGPYYRVDDNINKEYTEITFEQFKKHILKEHTMSDQTFTVTRAQLRKIHHVACDAWQEKISKMANKIGAFEDELSLTRDEVAAMFKAAGTLHGVDQKAVLKEIFPEYQKDNNAFVQRFDRKMISDISNKLFGDNRAFEIAVGAPITISREDLAGRSFYINPNYDVKLHNLEEGSTVIEITKK